MGKVGKVGAITYELYRLLVFRRTRDISGLQPEDFPAITKQKVARAGK